MKTMNCPKCNGKSGYEFKQSVTFTYVGRRDHPEIDRTGNTAPKEEIGGDDWGSMSKTVKCIDCGKRIKRELL